MHARRRPERARPLRPEEPLLARDREEVDAELGDADRDRADGLGAVDGDDRAAIVGEPGDRLEREAGPGGPEHVRERPRAGCRAGSPSSNAARIASSSSPARPSTVDDLGPVRAAAAWTGPSAPGMLGVGRHDPVARRRSSDQTAAFIAAGRRMGDRDLVDVGADDGRDGATRLGEPLEEGVPVVHRRAADPELVVDDLGHRGGRLGGHRADRPRVQVDPRAEGGKGLPDRGQLLGIGEEGRDHARMISAMSSPPAGRRLQRTRTRTPGGLARPELLASTDWLADQLGRPEVRILDVRWRPDGSGHQVWAAGHIPGAVFVDWRTDLTDTIRDRARPSCSPDRSRWPGRCRSPASATARPSWSTTTRSSLFAARVWWSLRVYGLE